MESLNVLTYGADPTNATDSLTAFQKAIDDAANLGRSLNASGSGSTLTLADQWHDLDPSDVGQNITIERDLGLSPSAYPLRIDQVLSSSQCTVKTAQNTPVNFPSFSNILVIWRRSGNYGKSVFAPCGQYKLNQSLQMLSEHVSLVGEQRGDYSDRVGTKLHFPFTTGIIQRNFLGADAHWMPFGPGLVSGASTSYQLKPTEPGVCWDYQDSLHMETSLNGLAAFTLECFLQPNATAAGAIISLIGALPDKGQELSLELTGVANNQLAATANLSGTNAHLGSSPVQTGTIYHVVMQFDGSAFTFFLNGVLQGTVSGLNGKSLVAKPYQNFQVGAWRTTFPGGGVIYNAYDCYLSHVRMSNVARYPVTGFTPPATALIGDNNTLVLDEGSPSQHGLFLVDVGGASPGYGFHRVKINRHILDSGGFMSEQKIKSLGIFSYGACIYARRAIGMEWDDLFLHTWSVGILGGPDTFSNKLSFLGIAGGRAGIVLAGPCGITSYSDITITGGKIGAWLRAGSGIISDWYLHGTALYQLILQDWEGSVVGAYFSNEDATGGQQAANMLIGGSNSDVNISGAKFETYAFPRPSIEIGNIRQSVIQAAFEPHPAATEILKFVGTPKAKIVLLNPTHGRLESSHPAGDVPWSISAPTGKLVVLP